MQIIHVPYSYWPDSIGGAEIYVRQLVQELTSRNISNTVWVSSNEDSRYIIDDSPVVRFSMWKEMESLAENYGRIDAWKVSRFTQLLKEASPDILHLHSFTPGYTPSLCIAAQALNIPYVFTYHAPSASCIRGTLLRWGFQVCNGALSQKACTRCYLHSKGLGRVISHLLGSLPISIGSLVDAVNCSNDILTAVKMPLLVQTYHAAVRELWANAARVIALCTWTYDLLVENDVPPQKISICRHGINIPVDQEHSGDSPALPPLRLAFLGRIDPTKGIDIIIETMRLLPDAPIVLDIYGLAQADDPARFTQYVMEQAATDSRIRFLSPIHQSEVVSYLRNYHFLVVPSYWLETGPLVVLEAFAAGIPVIGSNLGGIAELITDGRTGLLVEAGNPTALSMTIRQILDNPSLITHLRQNIVPPRTTHNVADEMLRLYINVLNDTTDH